MPPRVAILGPFETNHLRSFLHPTEARENMPPGMGGSSLVNLVLARLEHNLPTDVITLDPRADENMLRYEGDLVRLWVVKRRARKAMRDFYREEVAGLVHALSESKPDICHANWTYEYGLAALNQHVAPAVVTVHDHAGKMLRYIGASYLLHYVMAGRVIRKSGCLTAVSPHIAAYIRKRRGREPAVIPNLLSELVWKTKPEPDPKPPVVISALTWANYRNPKTALRAFAGAREKNPDAHYIMIGPGYESQGPAHHWAARRGLDAGVMFLGRVPYPEALTLIANASVLLHPSLEESFGGPVAEAMALGVPVVATRQAGGPAWLLGHHVGRVVNGHSIPEMTDALNTALTRPETFQLEAARKHIRQLCDPDRVLAQWDDLYRNTLKVTA